MSSVKLRVSMNYVKIIPGIQELEFRVQISKVRLSRQ